MRDLLRDRRTLELLNLLWNAGDREAGIAIVDLPKSLHNEALFTEWVSADLIEVIRRNHIHTGGGEDQKLVLEHGWDVAIFGAPNLKSPWQMFQEALIEDVADEIRHRIRVKKGDGELSAARLARFIAACGSCGAPLGIDDLTFDEETGMPEIRWCELCRNAVLAAKSKTIAGYKRAVARLLADGEAWKEAYQRADLTKDSPEYQDLHRRLCFEEARYRTIAREILGEPVDRAKSAVTLGQLWYFIEHVAIVVLETTQGSQYIQPVGIDPILEEVLGALHLFGVTWADEPPYPILNRQQTIDKLRIIANRIAQEDANNDLGGKQIDEQAAEAAAEKRYRQIAAQLIPGFHAPDDRFKMTALLFELLGLPPSEFDGLGARARLAFAERALLKKLQQQAPPPAGKKPVGSKPKAPRDKDMEARDKWIYEECCKGTAYDAIAIKLKSKSKSWDRIESRQGIRQAAISYAKRHDLPPPPSRQEL